MDAFLFYPQAPLVQNFGEVYRIGGCDLVLGQVTPTPSSFISPFFIANNALTRGFFILYYTKGKCGLKKDRPKEVFFLVGGLSSFRVLGTLLARAGLQRLVILDPRRESRP